MPGKKVVKKTTAPRRVNTVKNLHTSDMEVGQPKDIPLSNELNLTGGQVIESLGERDLNKDYADALQFMEEMVTVTVSESEDQNAENPVQVGVNGVFVLFYRGQPTTVKRKFVDALIVKSSKVRTEKMKTMNGEDTYAIRQTSALKFPFQIDEDKNPKGREWVRSRMAEPV